MKFYNQILRVVPHIGTPVLKEIFPDICERICCYGLIIEKWIVVGVSKESAFMA